jgi:two-component system response regulator RpaA
VKTLEILTTGEVARLCKVAPRTVSKWFDAGHLKGYRLPGSNDRRIFRDDLVRFMREAGMVLPLAGMGLPSVLVVGEAADVAGSLPACMPPGSAVAVARSALDAGRLWPSAKPTCVVIDGRRGGEAVALAAELRAMPSPPRVVLLAAEDDVDALALAGAEFDAVLQRPFSVAALARTITEAPHAGIA